MTSLLAGARKMVTRGTDIGARIEGLDRATTAARGRLDDALVDDARAAVDRAAGRLRLSAEHTVVALAGATGSGKSSTFNALTGLELSAVGVRRPTTSWATACVWGREGADELLEWLGIPARHQVTRDSMLDNGRRQRGEGALDGVVLLDLPDHDSTEVSHHLEVDRLVDARRPAGVGARPAEVRRRGDPRPLPRAAGQPPGRDAGRPQPHRHRARGPSPGHGRRRTPPAGARRPARRARARGQRPARHRHRRAARGDRTPGVGQEGDPPAARGRPARGGRAAGCGLRLGQDAACSPTSASTPSTTRSPRRPGSRRWWTPSSARPGCARGGPRAGR